MNIRSHPPGQTPPQHSAAWWRYGHVWLVIAGPAIVVTASMVTLWLALTRPDPLVDENYYRKGMEINATLARGGANLAPAVEARNHAAAPTATPGAKP